MEKQDQKENTHIDYVEDAKAKLDTIEDAKVAARDEHEETLWQAIKQNRRAVFCSAIVSLTIIMEGYDIGLISQFYAYPSFAEQFGHYDVTSQTYQLSAAWQAGLGNGGNVGVIIGGFLNGWLSDRFGYKRVILAALFCMNLFVFFPFFAKTPEVLLVGQIFCGLTWGVFATTGPAYASEVCPMALRGYLTCYINLCWATGQLIGAGIIYGLLDLKGSRPYRVAYAVQWVWPIPLMAAIWFFVPESPWFLIRKGRVEDAYKSLESLDNKGSDSHKRTIAQITHTLQIEEEMQTGSSYLDCFRGTDRRRTEIVCMTFAGQILSGSPFAYGPTYFFQQAGISTRYNYQIAVGGTGMAFVGTIISWFLLSRFGRRTLYLGGMLVMCAVLLIIGVLASASTAGGVKWGQAAMCLCWLFTYSMTVGPICYTIISETSSLRLRAKSICLSRNIYNMAQIIANVIMPRLLNPTELNLKGKTAYFWLGTATLAAIWAYFRLPECKDRTYAELDVMFHKKVSARKFSKYEVNAFEEELSERQ